MNTDGGFLSGSHAGSCGVFTVIELVRQLRHEAGPRQVEGASWRTPTASAACRTCSTAPCWDGREMPYEGFLPEIPERHQPFWDSVRRHGPSCSAATSAAPSASSRASGARAGRPTAPGRRSPAPATCTRTPSCTGRPTPAYQAMAPYVIAHVTMAEGPRMISTVVGCEPAAVTVGMGVELVYDDVTPELTLYRFKPRRSS